MQTALFDRFFKDEYPRAMTVACQVCHTWDAEDILTECFLYVWNMWHQFGTIEQARAYFYKMVRNRRNKHQQKTFVYCPMEQFENIADDSLDDRDRLHWMHRRIDELSPRKQDVLRLLFYGYSTSQVGATLGMTQDTVRNHKRFALKQLKQFRQLEIEQIKHRKIFKTLYAQK